MDPILTLPDSLPPHRAAPLQPVPCVVVADWPAGVFLENLAVLDDGSIAVSVLSEARIDRVEPDGRRSVLRQFAAPTTGLAVLDGSLFAVVGVPDAAPMTLWRLDGATGEGAPVMVVADAVFLNGLTPFDGGRLLATDSRQGRLYLIDPSSQSATVWLQDARLSPAPGVDVLPGANGVKRWGDMVYVASTGRALFLRTLMDSAGAAGPLEIVADALRVDDFAFDLAGTAYLTTHIGQSVDRLDRDGERVSIAGPDHGAAGSTACAFGRTAKDRTALYVTTTGGLITPPGGVVQPAKLLRLEVGVEGAPLDRGRAA